MKKREVPHAGNRANPHSFSHSGWNSTLLRSRPLVTVSFRPIESVRRSHSLLRTQSTSSIPRELRPTVSAERHRVLVVPLKQDSVSGAGT